MASKPLNLAKTCDTLITLYLTILRKTQLPNITSLTPAIVEEEIDPLQSHRHSHPAPFAFRFDSLKTVDYFETLHYTPAPITETRETTYYAICSPKQMVQSHQTVSQPVSYGHGHLYGGSGGGEGGTTTYPMTPRSYAQPGPSTPSTPYQRATSPKMTATPRRARLDKDKTLKPGQTPSQHTAPPLGEPNPNLPHRADHNAPGSGQGGLVKSPIKSPETVKAGHFNQNVNGVKQQVNPNGASRPSPLMPVKEPLRKIIGFDAPGVKKDHGGGGMAQGAMAGQVAARRAALEKAAAAGAAGGQRPVSARHRPPRLDASAQQQRAYPAKSTQPPICKPSSSESSYKPSGSSQAYTSNTSSDTTSHSDDSSHGSRIIQPNQATTSQIKQNESRKPKGRPYNYDRAMREMPQKTPRFLRQRAREAELEEAKRAEEGTVVSIDGPVARVETVPDRLGSWQVGKEVGTGANGQSLSL